MVYHARTHGGWRSDPGASAPQTLTLDFGQPREFGGLILHWFPHEYASNYRVELSDDGKTWRRVREVPAGNGGSDPLMLTEIAGFDENYLHRRLRIAA